MKFIHTVAWMTIQYEKNTTYLYNIVNKLTFSCSRSLNTTLVSHVLRTTSIEN